MSSRVTQEALEVVLSSAVSSGNVRATQEAVEVVIAGAAPPDAAAQFIVEAVPRVRWGATVPVNGFVVESVPRVLWDAGLTDPYIRFGVRTAPKVRWNSAGAATTECIGGPGVVPPPDEPAADSSAQNYVF